jgi:long-subunit fatty acid transport protein
MRHTCLALRLGRLFALATLIVSSAAHAAGIYLPENGAGVAARGGTAIGVIDSAYALQFNPAGLAFVDGLDVRVELTLINPANSFTPASSGTRVDNSSGLSTGPVIMAAYHLPGLARMFAVGVGAWGPSGALSYKYSPTEATRYNNIQQTTIVFYPSIGVAFRPISWISIGVTASYIVQTVDLTTSLVGLPPDIAKGVGAPGGPDDDVVAHVNTVSRPQLTGLFGIVAAPIPGLTIGASFSPQQIITTDGSLSVTPGDDLKMNYVKSITKNDAACKAADAPPASCDPKATLKITLPPVVRFGAAYKFWRLGFSAEYVYEGWSTNKAFSLDTNGAVINFSSPAISGILKLPPSPNCPMGDTCVGNLNIPNGWRDAHSGRAGVSYDILRPNEKGFLVQVAAGGVYMSNPIPWNRQSLPYIAGGGPGGGLWGGSVGASFAWKGFGVNFGGMFMGPTDFTVSNSSQPLPAAVPASNGPTIGNGRYTTNYWLMDIGLSYQGLSENKT